MKILTSEVRPDLKIWEVMLYLIVFAVYGFVFGSHVEREKQDRVPYSLWIKQGYITATEGDVVDYDYIKKYIKDITLMS